MIVNWAACFPEVVALTLLVERPTLSFYVTCYVWLYKIKRSELLRLWSIAGKRGTHFAGSFLISKYPFKIETTKSYNIYGFHNLAQFQSSISKHHIMDNCFGCSDLMAFRTLSVTRSWATITEFIKPLFSPLILYNFSFLYLLQKQR